MEGDRSLLADPSIIAPQYRKALQAYLEALDKAVRDAGVDYRVQVQDNYEEVLARFLIRRTPKKGGGR